MGRFSLIHLVRIDSRMNLNLVQLWTVTLAALGSGQGARRLPACPD
jgi:hypothetical protein